MNTSSVLWVLVQEFSLQWAPLMSFFYFGVSLSISLSFPKHSIVLISISLSPSPCCCPVLSVLFEIDFTCHVLVRWVLYIMFSITSKPIPLFE